jgi:hypothetical protein
MSISKKKASLKKKKHQGEIVVNLRQELAGLSRGQRKRSFAEIERLIALSRQAKNKTALHR